MPINVAHISKRKALLGFVTTLTLAAVFLFNSSICKPTRAICHILDTTRNQNMTPVEIAPGYVEYSVQGVNEALAANKKVVLYFWAPWCTSCSSLDVEIEKDPTIIPKDTVIFQIQYDSEEALKNHYGVVIQHTFVEIDKNKKMLNQWVGGSTQELRERLK